MRGLLLVIAARLGATGTKTPAQTEQQALWYLHYLCGVNALNMLYATNMAGIGGEHSVWRIYHTWYPYGNANYYGKPPATWEPDYPYYAGTDSIGISDNQTSTYGPFPGIVADGPDEFYPEAGCAAGGVTPPVGGLDGVSARHRFYRDWAFCCQGPDATGAVACPWQVNETGIYYISAFAALAGQFMSGSAKLTAALDPLPAAPQIGQWFDVRLRVTNPGGVDATGVTATLSIDAGAARLTAVTLPSAAPTTLTAGGSATYVWSFSITGAGILAFTATAAGTDAMTLGPLLAAASRSTAAVVPSTLATTLSVAPSTAVVGSTVTATLQVTNTGQAGAACVTPFLSSAGTGALRLLTGPVPSSTVLLAPGGTQVFTWTLAVDVPGSLDLTVTVRGTDAASAKAVTGGATRALTAATAASLACAASVSSTRLAVGQTVTLRYTVSDTGGIQADGVVPLLIMAGSGTLVVAAGPAPVPPVTIAGKGVTTFVWTLSA
ncbi:MAG: hypothetical protein AAB368_13470, partial [bacterium]